MSNRRSVNAIISISGMLLLLALAYGIDSLRQYTDRYYQETFSHGFEIHLSYVITNLLLSGAIVLWLWFVFVRVDLDKWVYAIFVCTGLLITIYPIIYFTDLGVLYVAYRLSPIFQIYLTSGIIAMAGVLKLITTHKKP
jgi:hypothetical protein